MKLVLGMIPAFFVIIGCTLLTGLAALDTSESLKQDPLWVVRTFNDALNSRKVDAALARFAERAVFVDASGRSSTDRDTLARWLHSQICENAQSELSDIWMNAGSVTFTTRVHRGDAILQSEYHVEIDGGKIDYLAVVSDPRADGTTDASALNVRAGSWGKNRDVRWQTAKGKNFLDIASRSSREKQCSQR